MQKLVILVESTNDPAFDENWPQFLHQVEQMPGLRREATSRVDKILVGTVPFALIHELYFDTPQELYVAMASAPGKEAGRLLQLMTDGRVTLLVVDHKEDDLDNIRRFKKTDETHPVDANAK
jgi:hypothetical protein